MYGVCLTPYGFYEIIFRESSMAKQSKFDRRERLAKGLCPIHGEVWNHFGWTDGQELAIVKCCRKDCRVTGTQKTPDSEIELTSEFLYLIE